MSFELNTEPGPPTPPTRSDWATLILAALFALLSCTLGWLVCR